MAGYRSVQRGAKISEGREWDVRSVVQPDRAIDLVRQVGLGEWRHGDRHPVSLPAHGVRRDRLTG
jgi:hypothetical protein